MICNSQLSLRCVVIGISRWRDLSVTMHNNEFAHEIKVTNKIMIFTSANELIIEWIMR